MFMISKYELRTYEEKKTSSIASKVCSIESPLEIYENININVLIVVKANSNKVEACMVDYILKKRFQMNLFSSAKIKIAHFLTFQNI